MSGSRPPGRTVFGEAFRLAVPATLSLLLHACYRVNDQYWIQDLGAGAQAALGVTSFMLIFNFAFVLVIHSGTLARAARACGAGDRGAVERSLHTAIKFGGLWFVLVAAAGLASVDFWVSAVGARGATAGLAHAYLRVLYLGFPVLAFKPVLDALFIGLGNTFIPMLLSLASVALNFILNPLLIYGWGPFPELGIAGAAWATVISRGLAAGVSLLVLLRFYRLPLRLARAIDWAEVRTVARIGIPMAVSTAGYAGVFIAVLKTTVEPLGEAVQAGLGVAFNGVEAISYCGLMGPAVAVSSMVGRRLGAGDRAGARAAVRACMLLSTGIALGFTGAFLFAPEAVARVYSRDPAVLRQAVLYLWVVAWSQTATAAQAVLEQALAGAGHTAGMAVLNTLGNALRVPLAWFFAIRLEYGPAAAWWSMNATNWLKLAAIFLVYRQGRWEQGAVQAPPLQEQEDAGREAAD